jgi:hypothetical protein
MEDLAILCELCHKKVHELAVKFKDLYRVTELFIAGEPITKTSKKTKKKGYDKSRLNMVHQNMLKTPRELRKRPDHYLK